MPRKKRGWWRTLLNIVVVILAIAGLGSIIAGVAAFVIYDNVAREGTAGEIVKVEIPKGATGDDIGHLLEENGLVDRALYFQLALRMADADSPIKAGRYELPRGLSANQLLDRMYQGPVMIFDPSTLPPEQIVTIPEGLPLTRMAALFDNPEAFLEAAADSELRDRLGVEADTLEGYLMPNTYYFDEPPSEHEVVKRMVEQFQKNWTDITHKFPEAAQRDRHELLTIASLIEEEARSDEERPKVAAVIYNRLDKGMALEFDSTLQYALQKYGQRMLNRDKEVESPYNTYKYPNLPPGPISNPGVASIEAAIDPADLDYLFFVSNADGKTHTFSSTLAEHNRAVARYRREAAEQRRQQRIKQEANDQGGQ